MKLLEKLKKKRKKKKELKQRSKRDRKKDGQSCKTLKTPCHLWLVRDKTSNDLNNILYLPSIILSLLFLSARS